MSPDLRTTVIWGGGAAVAVLIGLVWTISGAATVDQQRAATAKLAGDLARAQPSGVRLDQQVDTAKSAADQQRKALDQVTTALVPPLKSDYSNPDLTSATSRIANDAKSLRQRAQRTRVSLPAALPFDGGLDADPTVREQQLAQMYLVRTALDLIMDAGVERIGNVTLGPAFTDPTATYATFTLDTEITGTFDVLQDALLRLQAAHQQGVGIRAVTLGGDGTSRATQAATSTGPAVAAVMRSKLTISLLVPASASWRLPQDKLAAPAATAGAGSGSTPAPAGKSAPASSGKGL